MYMYIYTYTLSNVSSILFLCVIHLAAHYHLHKSFLKVNSMILVYNIVIFELDTVFVHTAFCRRAIKTVLKT